MRKVIALPMVLAAFCMAHQVVVDNHTFVNVYDEYQDNSKVLRLRLNVHNSENRTKQVRIAGKISGLDEQKKYYFGGCEVDKIPGVDAMVNFYKSSSINQYVLDIMVDVPQGDRDLCINFVENNWTDFKTSDFSIDWKGSADGAPLDYVTGDRPIDNKYIYNYVDKRLKRDIEENTSKLSYGDRFQATTLFDGTTEDLSEEQRFESFNANLNYSKKVPAISLVDLHIGSFGVYKDTRMLMTSLGVDIGKYRWNESTFDGHFMLYQSTDERIFSLGRCWAVGVFNIYSYYNGNRNSNDHALTQDEMVFMAKTKTDDSDYNLRYGFFVPNNSEGASNSVSATLMNDVMPGSNAVSHDFDRLTFGGPEIFDFVKESADGWGKPLYISICEPGHPCHALLIDGIALTDDAKRDTLVHLVNLDNFGNEGYIYLNALKKVLRGYLTYDRPYAFTVTNSEYPVDVDSDGDGIVDFDEKYRFNDIDENMYSSDNNGVSDYDKIFYSTITLPVISSQIIENRELYTVDYRYTTSSNDITLYALDYLSVNDNVTCLKNKKDKNQVKELIDGCRVASEGMYKDNAVRIGSRALVGMIYSKSGVFVRDNGIIGSAFMYNRGLNDYGIYYEDHRYSDAPVAYFMPEAWPFSVDKTVESINDRIGNEQKIVRNGETFTISDEDGHNGFSFLKVENGGTLVIGTGDMYIGNIQLETGSFFKFEHPSMRSELHLNGNVIWRGTYLANDDYLGTNLDYATARGFKLIQHSNQEMYIGSEWHGFIYAPYSKVVMGQTYTSKKIYGQIFGRIVVVHQNSVVYHVAYNPVIPTLAKSEKYSVCDKKEIATSVTPANVKISNVNRNTINFTSSTPGKFHVSVMKLDGSVVASTFVESNFAGAQVVDWNSNGVPNGAYMLSIKHDGKVYGKMISLK